jgi:hypothetical protein
MGIARNLARLVPNGSGLLPNANIEAVAATKLTGILPDANAPSGSVLQVLSTTKTDTFTTSSGTFVDVPGLSIDITPISATSKIFIMATITGHPTVSGCFLNGTIARNSTALGLGDAAGSKSRTMGAINYGPDGGGMFTMSLCFLDSPLTTSLTTYKCQVNTSGHNGPIVAINRSIVDDSDTRARASSTITVMEIAA